LESQIIEELTKKILKNFLDEILIYEIGTCPKSGYDILTDISQRFNYRLSSGTVYSKLYCMERDGILKCNKKQRKRVCELTDYGKQVLNIMENSPEFTNIVSKALNIESPQKWSASQIRTHIRNYTIHS
jgi:DNA-binding PadR family transcriptional regulator